MTLTAQRPVPVRFAGGRALDGPLTYGQANIMRWLETADEVAHATLGWDFDVPDEVTVEDVAATLGALLARHEGLRTTYNSTRQRVVGSGELELKVYACTAEPPDKATLIAALAAELAGEPYDRTRELPLRAAVATWRGQVRLVIAGFSHLTVDRQAVEILDREFAELIRDPAARSAARFGCPPPRQPLDQALVESTPPVQRRAAAALRYFEDLLGRMPQCLYAAPSPAQSAEPGKSAEPGESLAVEMRSAVAAAALPRAAARVQVTRSSIVLAAVCAVLGERTGEGRCAFTMLSGNRFERPLAGYVGTLVQTGLLEVDTDVMGFDALARRVWSAGLRTCRHGLYDISSRTELTERIERERGVRFCFEPLFNSVVVDPARPRETAAAISGRTLARTRLTARPMPPTEAVVRFDLWEADEELGLEAWTGDTGRVPRGELESLLRAVERLIVAAADGDLDRARITALVGLAPLARGSGWQRIDNCWIEPAQVRRLVADALAPVVSQVFAAVDGVPLVAFLGGAENFMTVAEIHTMCQAALSGRPTAMTPRHYVLCDGVPDDPADLTAWRRLPVLEEGSGR